MGEIIYSRQNERVKYIVKLRQASVRKRTRQFLVEGGKEIGEALRAGVELEQVLFCPHYFRDGEQEGVLGGVVCEKQELTKQVFEKVSYRENPDGLLAVANCWDTSLSGVKLGRNPLVLVLEGVEKPGNLGGMLRSADGCGADAVILAEPQLDPFNPNVVRASRGALFHMPFAVGSNEEVLGFLKEHEIGVFATTPHTERLYWDVDMGGASAILVGSEARGLSDFWLEHGVGVKIPLEGGSDSLNASIAAATTLYEALRQRRG